VTRAHARPAGLRALIDGLDARPPHEALHGLPVPARELGLELVDDAA